ncbi:hypothetical protein F4861DRAFT_534009 [Xylaria intraflava]|nr:hypothetical protein F4861DRAFT_534009 [Xylaria intraflava]
MAARNMENDLKGAAVTALPTPAGTPYRTPSRKSRKSRRPIASREVSPSPPALPTDKMEKKIKRASKDVALDENVSFLDPRRFTPTLHASLVSEILTLRRDQEEKLKVIEVLETSLHTVYEEKAGLQSTLSDTSKESRSLKRQLALLEGGTTSAIGELARERDEAVDANTETKRRLDNAQKKIRSLEEDSQRTNELWTKEKDDWTEDRRRLERQLHVAESRLKQVIEEVAQIQDAQSNVDTVTERDAFDNDRASIRTQSITNSVRFSTLSSLGIGKINGASLADELNFDDDDQTDVDGRQSVLWSPGHRRNTSGGSISSVTHRRNYSIDSQARPGSLSGTRLHMNQSVLRRLEGNIEEDEETEAPSRKVEYADAACSPPPSPKTVISRFTPDPFVRAEGWSDVENSPRVDGEIEANQRRKRVRVSRQGPIEPPKVIPESMVSSASQTVEPLSPRLSRLFTEKPNIEAKPKATETKSMATQTEDAPTQKKPTPLTIPSISIVPPTSCPPTPREHRLPQYFKDVGCQVSLLKPPNTASRSIAVQTDEIRVDTRLNRLPRHLHPSIISSRPPSPIPNADTENKTVPEKLPPRNPRRLASQSSVVDESNVVPAASPPPADSELYDTYPGGNDNGPLSFDKPSVRRPPRISSLFAGFDAISSDEGDDVADGEFSDTEYRTALSAPNPRTGANGHIKRSLASGGSTSPEDTRRSPISPRSLMRPAGGLGANGESTLGDVRDGSSWKPPRHSPIGMGSSSRASVMRKAAMIQNGISSHRGRSRSPSILDIQEPPFPIPTRASSRQPGIPGSAPSDGSRGSSHYSGGWHRRGSRSNIYRNNSIRKVRSAAAIPRAPRYRRQDSYSPPPMSPSETTVGSPELPPLPRNDITRPRSRDTGAGRYRTQTANTDNTNTNSAGSSAPAVGVVDAIAQTMVGEWMFKYVRRRRSFGVADASGREENSNDRHKRWVWLAPYEQAILWSGKQPSSGSALMGKAGRKLTIKSVLDVKDDNPIPKGETQIFNRSILILTPQRALKFTAASAERHYLWIMALSFLAHSSQAVPQITSSLAPPKAAPPPDPELSKAKPRKGAGIRDSIRLTKGRNPTLMARRENMQPRLQEEPEPVPEFPAHIEREIPLSIPTHQREPSEDPAEPPMIPRFHGRGQQGRIHERANQVMLHGRRRSNTGGHVPPPLSFRGFSPTPSSINASVNSAVEASIDSPVSSNMTWGMSTAGSQRTHDTFSRPTGNFFEAIGTVRMEAFIDPLTSKFDNHIDESEEWRYRARRQSKERRRHRSRSRRRDSLMSRETRDTRGTGSYRAGGDEDYFRNDPFRGF